MNLIDFTQSILLLLQSRQHLIATKQQLETISYQQLIHQPFNTKKKNRSIQVIVKSYFWACRLVQGCDCLPRSIALYQNLKSAGYQVEHKFGVNKGDKELAAHAWVEYQGEPLNEAEDLYSRFTVLENPSESLK